MRRRRFEQYPDMISRLFPEKFSDSKNLTRTVTFQVTDACNLACSYCYQIKKGTKRMSFEIAKKFIDLLLTGEKGMKEYINPDISPAVVLDFIGGEPLLEVELMDKIVNYFRTKAIELEHPWVNMFSICISSNGTLYFDEKVKQFLEKNKNLVSFNVTIDGNKELHDSCRKFPDGSPSYDLAVSAAKDWMSKGYYMGSKITIAPGNVMYLYDAIVHMVELGYKEINANCVYEKGWTIEHSRIFYGELKKLANYWEAHDLFETHYLSLFEEHFFRPKKEDDLINWCGGTGTMLSCDPDGKLFPCIRYMESSLGGEQKPLSIGDVDNGIGQNKCDKECINCLNKIDRRTQSTDECFYCPIAEGCSWCSAYNYQVNGTPDKRVTYICEMHKARSLANVYFWNQYYKKHNINKVFKMNCPDEWALPIVGLEELEILKKLQERNDRT